MFPYEISKIFMNTYFEEHLQTTASENRAKIIQKNSKGVLCFFIYNLKNLFKSLGRVPEVINKRRS